MDINKFKVKTTKTKTRKKKIWNKIKIKYFSLIQLQHFSLAGTYSGSRPFFMALCLSCCFCLSFNSLSCKDNHTGIEARKKLDQKRKEMWLIARIQQQPTFVTFSILDLLLWIRSRRGSEHCSDSLLIKKMDFRIFKGLFFSDNIFCVCVQ